MAAPVRIVLPVPFPLATVNAWLFSAAGSERGALVDCGVSSTPSYQGLLDGLRGAGSDPAGLDLYVTHGHVDHAGNAARLRTDFNVPLIAPPEESGYIETFRRDGPARNDEFSHALCCHGMAAADVARLREDSDKIDRFLDDVPISHPLAPEGTVTFGDETVQVLRTPGHTPGSTCYLTEDHGLLSGDTLLERITSNAVELRDADHGNYHRYVQSVDALRRFVGTDVLPGHHDPFRLTDAIIDFHLDHHTRRRQKILALLDRPTSARDVMRQAYPAWTSDPELFMGMAEIVGHLHSLHLDGLVTVTTGDDAVRRFRRA